MSSTTHLSRVVRLAVMAGLAVLVSVRPAAADITAFLGVTPTPENRIVRGLSGGLGLLIIGFEFEYANATEDEEALLPGLRTYSGNVLLQTPVEVSGVQLYGTAGVGLYRERLLDASETSTAVNLGGGAKIRLLGPLRLRLDYRVFRLQGDPINQNYQRFYAGANLAF
ncbi:MAG: hypothetical protein R2712_06400 [Vicinamibacterales bacterium]